MTPHGAWRLYAAAAICLVSLGLAWRSSVDFGLQMGLTMPTSYLGADGYHYTSTSSSYWYYGAEGVEVLPGFRSDVRALLVPAAALLAWAATHRTDRTRRLARGAGVAMAALVLVACSRGMIAAAASMTVALWLAVPVIWPAWAHRLTRSPRGSGAPAQVATDLPPATGSAF